MLSGAAPPRRAERAMDSVRMQLVRRDAGVIQLLTPPFDQSPLDPGYIKGYLPGVRENGGQYTHAALWTVMAIAQLGNGDEAVELFHMLNPINHTRTPADVERYKVEPYVVAADVYTHPPHIGRGGWTWYTGSAAWMYRLGLESILGLRRRGEHLAVAPCVPATWDGFVVRWRHGRSVLRDPRGESRAPDPRRRGGVAGRRRGRRPARSRWWTTARCTTCAWSWASRRPPRLPDGGRARGSEPRGGAGARRRRVAHLSPSATRSLTASSFIVNGFWMKFTPSSRTPRWAITSVVWLDMNRTFVAG